MDAENAAEDGFEENGCRLLAGNRVPLDVVVLLEVLV
jgi:hypothetical protein